MTEFVQSGGFSKVLTEFSLIEYYLEEHFVGWILFLYRKNVSMLIDTPVLTNITWISYISCCKTYLNTCFERNPSSLNDWRYNSIKQHWVPLTTSKKMQQKLLVISGCSLYLNFLTLQSIILMQGHLLVTAGCSLYLNFLTLQSIILMQGLLLVTAGAHCNRARCKRDPV